MAYSKSTGVPLAASWLGIVGVSAPFASFRIVDLFFVRRISFSDPQINSRV